VAAFLAERSPACLTTEASRHSDRAPWFRNRLVKLSAFTALTSGLGELGEDLTSGTLKIGQIAGGCARAIRAVPSSCALSQLRLAARRRARELPGAFRGRGLHGWVCPGSPQVALAPSVKTRATCWRPR
jgi:hypothetical protein